MCTMMAIFLTTAFTDVNDTNEDAMITTMLLSLNINHTF